MRVMWKIVVANIMLQESFHRRARQRRAAVVAEHELQSQIVSQHQYVYTIQNNRCVPVMNQYHRNGVILHPQGDDLPPKYEEVVISHPDQPTPTHQPPAHQPQAHQPHQQRSAF
ncbi:hypothetical protein Bhyg_03256 [Pseudolycoriella hygida]|uniref:Uncharacterized protein n=1 Tax=Pseudolycoriella hygida TaxID=35572 RepID=A0A9Q0NEI8_9DIPT|nr:hypothetical protein Bhyg_03256 [Pseudolycoriella hygida]